MKTKQNSRITEFDGIRGAAALVVVVHHTLLLFPEVSTAAFEHKKPENDFVAWLAHSPAHIFWTGSEAVFLFFLLSGIVVPRLWMKLEADASLFLPSRLIRLYLPIWGALALAVVTIQVFPRETGKYGAYFDWLSSPLTFEKVLADLVLLPKSGMILGVLWSMTWEIIFIFTLPLMLLLARTLRPKFLLPMCFFGTSLGFYWENDPLMFLPIFQIGVVVSINWGRFSKKILLSKTSEVSVWIFSILTISSTWWLLGQNLTHNQNRAVTMPLVLTGILAVMWLSQQNSLLKPILNSKPMQFLGTISFSLYLTHEPIILALVTMRGGAGWHLILSIPISIAVGWLFYVAIESKAHKASKRFLSKRTKRL